MIGNKTNTPATKEVNIFSQLWFKYFPYWPLFLALTVMSIAGAWLYIRYKTTPFYEASAQILIKDEKKGQEETKMMESLNLLSSKKIIENETEVLKSRELMYHVIKNRHLYASVYQKGKIKSLSAYSTSPVHIEARYPDSLRGSDKIFFSVDNARKKVKIQANEYKVNEWVKTPWGEIRFVPQDSQPLSTNDPFFFTLANPKALAVSMAGRVQVAPVSKLSSVISLKLMDVDPKRAEDILNELIIAYNTAALNDKNTLAANTMAWVEERLKYVEHDLDSIEKKLQNYKASRGAIDISSQGTLYLENVSNINQRMGDVNTQIAVLDQVEKYVKAKDNASGIVPSTVGVNDPLLTQLIEKLYNAELEYDKIRKTTAANNPMALSLKEQIDKMRPSILENINTQRSGLYANKNNLGSLNNKFSSMLSSIPQKERDLVEISRDQNIKSSLYNFLLTKREETALALSASMADSRTIDKAQAYGPIMPGKKIYVMALVLALALGVGLVSAKELFKRTVLYRQEIEKFTSVPIIGEISYDKSNEPLVIGDGKRTFIAEQFRNLRTSLPYIGIKGDRKRLLVTSTISGEGKSFIVANLGMSLAMTGKKVVVLEFDLSDPTLSKKLGIEGATGLSEYLNGEARKEDIVRPTNLNENLFIISSGALPDNPSELITSDKVPELITYLSAFYDYVILDSAPVGLLSDAYILSSYCDATLYVVRHRHTPKLSIQRIDENNKINELKNLAIVFNGVRSRGFGNSAYGYGYGYGYGYVYNNGKKGKKKRNELKPKVA